MKRYDKREQKNIGLALCCVLLLVSALTIVGCARDEEQFDYVEILSRICEGDEREEALEALSDAWYHSECRLLYGDVEDIFLYGPKERAKVTVISIYSKPRGEGLVVDHTGIYENYFLDASDFGEHCEPPVQKAFE